MTAADRVAEALFAAIEAGDIDAVPELYDPDVEVWNYTDGVTQDRAANLRTLGWVIGEPHRPALRGDPPPPRAGRVRAAARAAGDHGLGPAGVGSVMHI